MNNQNSTLKVCEDCVSVLGQCKAHRLLTGTISYLPVVYPETLIYRVIRYKNYHEDSPTYYVLEIPRCHAPAHHWEHSLFLDGFNWYCKNCRLQTI